MKAVRLRRRSLATLPLALLITACVSRLPPAPPVASQQRFAGRLAMQVAAGERTAAQSLSAAFELRGRPEAGDIELATSLGTLLAQARWSPSEVLLVTPQGTRRYADLNELSRVALGEALPLAALFDWLSGRPWPGASSSRLSDGAAQGFVQLGWEVDVSRFDAGLIAARRPLAPTVQLRVQLDR